jgi:glycosyltransferase involved in cell wall biosynthesis
MHQVSIIIPTYNSEEFISEALDSVKNQTFQDFEIIVVDDGSSDSTREIVKGHPTNPKLLEQKNSGPASARNRGIGLAHGKYVAFLDADDLWCSTKLEKQIARFESDNTLGMVFTENYLFDSRGTFLDSLDKAHLLMKGVVAQNILHHSGVSTPTVMVRKSVLDEVGGFEESLRHAEDDNLWIRITAQYPVALIDEPLVGVRDHSKRTTRNNSLSLSSDIANVTLLQTKYGPKVSETIAPALPRKLSAIHFEAGYAAFQDAEYGTARRAFLEAVRLCPTQMKPYRYLIVSLLPAPCIKGLLWVKRNILSVKLHRNRWVRGG